MTTCGRSGGGPWKCPWRRKPRLAVGADIGVGLEGGTGRAGQEHTGLEVEQARHGAEHAPPGPLRSRQPRSAGPSPGTPGRRSSSLGHRSRHPAPSTATQRAWSTDSARGSRPARTAPAPRPWRTCAGPAAGEALRLRAPSRARRAAMPSPSTSNSSCASGQPAPAACRVGIRIPWNLETGDTTRRRPSVSNPSSRPRPCSTRAPSLPTSALVMRQRHGPHHRTVDVRPARHPQVHAHQHARGPLPPHARHRNVVCSRFRPHQGRKVTSCLTDPA